MSVWVPLSSGKARSWSRVASWVSQLLARNPCWQSEGIPWLSTCFSTLLTMIWAATWQKQQNECSPSEDSDQPGHPLSLIRVFAVCMKKAWVLSYAFSAQRILWSDWADAKADLSLRWAHNHFVGFLMSRLNFVPPSCCKGRLVIQGDG